MALDQTENLVPMAEVMAKESGHNSGYELEFKVPSLLTTQLGGLWYENTPHRNGFEE